MIAPTQPIGARGATDTTGLRTPHFTMCTKEDPKKNVFVFA